MRCGVGKAFVLGGSYPGYDGSILVLDLRRVVEDRVFLPLLYFVFDNLSCDGCLGIGFGFGVVLGVGREPGHLVVFTFPLIANIDVSLFLVETLGSVFI